MKKLCHFLMLVAPLLWCFGCMIHITEKQLAAGDYDRWLRKFRNKAPLNEKQGTLFETQYIAYLNRVRQLQLAAETELNLHAAKELASFPTLSAQALKIHPPVAQVHAEKDWYEDLKLLALSFEDYVRSRQALKGKKYDQALTSLSNCPAGSATVQSLRALIKQELLLHYHDRFEQLRLSRAFNPLAQELTGLFQLTEKHGLPVEDAPYYTGKYPDFGAYLSELRQSALQHLEQTAEAFVQDHDYLQAVDDLEKALLAGRTAGAKEADLQRLSDLEQQTRKEGIRWHRHLREQAEAGTEFGSALEQVDILCRLDTIMDCTAERNRLLHRQFIKEAKAIHQQCLYQAAITKLENPPACSAGHPETRQLLGTYKDEFGNKILAEGDVYLRSNDYTNALERFRKAGQLLSDPQIATDRITECKNKWGSQLMQEGELCLTRQAFDEAIGHFERAKELLSEPAIATEKIRQAKDQKGRSMYPEAARNAAAGDCIAAAEIIKKARPLVINRNEAERLYQHYLKCATKKIAIVLQADDPYFQQSSEKYQIIDRIAQSLKGEYREILYSTNLPVIGIGGNPFEVAGQIGADQVMVVAFEQPVYRQYRDHEGTTLNYCYSTAEKLQGLYGLVEVLNYYLTPVTIYRDRAEISMRISAKLLDVQQGNQPAVVSHTISRSWNQESWYSQTRPEYIRYCPSRMAYLRTFERTDFVDAGKFNKERTFPSGMDLIRNDLLQTVGSIASGL